MLRFGIVDYGLAALVCGVVSVARRCEATAIGRLEKGAQFTA